MINRMLKLLKRKALLKRNIFRPVEKLLLHNRFLSPGNQVLSMRTIYAH